MGRKVVKWTKAEWDAFWAWLKEPAQGATAKETNPWYCEGDWEEPATAGPATPMSSKDFYGELRWQGDGKAIDRADLFDGIDMVTAIQKWLNKRGKVTIVVECDTNRVEAAIAAIEALDLGLTIKR